MKIEDIYNLWQADSVIESTQLEEESIKIPRLHHKYFKIFSNERLVLKKLESEFKKLELDKWEFYTNGPTKEQIDKGWRLPAQGKILKNEVERYLLADDDLIKEALKINLQREKIDLLDSIIKNINNRSFQIKNAIEFIRFSNGG